MEYVEWVEPETFPGTIAPFARNKEEGAKEAKQHVDATSDICFSTEFSKLVSGRMGANVV